MKYVDTSSLNDYEDVDDAHLNRYRKKKPSSVSKAATKSKHKHEFQECILISEEDNVWRRAEYCIHCGKIHNVFIWETVRTERGYYVALSQDELKKKFAKLPRFHVHSIWDNVVDLGGIQNA